MNQEQIIQTGQISTAESVGRFVCGMLEYVASSYALPVEPFIRREMGFRYFSTLGLICVLFLVWPITLGVASMASDIGEWRAVEISFTGGGPSEAEIARRAYQAQSEAGVWLFFRVAMVAGVLQKLSMLYRRVTNQEPPISTFGGYFFAEAFLQRVSYFGIPRFTRSTDDAVKMVIEPAFVYVLARFVVAPFINAGIGNVLMICACAMAIRAYLVVKRVRDSILDVSDLNATWERRLHYVGNGANTNAHGGAGSESVPVTIPKGG